MVEVVAMECPICGGSMAVIGWFYGARGVQNPDARWACATCNFFKDREWIEPPRPIFAYQAELARDLDALGAGSPTAGRRLARIVSGARRRHLREASVTMGPAYVLHDAPVTTSPRLAAPTDDVADEDGYPPGTYGARRPHWSRPPTLHRAPRLASRAS